MTSSQLPQTPASSTPSLPRSRLRVSSRRFRAPARSPCSLRPMRPSQKLPKGTIEALLNDKEKLTAILTYHVVSGKVMAADIIKSGGAEPATVNGAQVSITIRDGKVYVDGAQVTAADIQASNGVIHVIDAVIMPAPVAASAAQ